MKEGRLSSDLLKRYGISEQNAVGKVLWHSLNENGDIGVYDMKFGNTIVRNLTENELLDEKCPPHCNETKHGVQNENDANRGLQENETEDIYVFGPETIKKFPDTAVRKEMCNNKRRHGDHVQWVVRNGKGRCEKAS
jgi:hypothetical protein